MKILDKMRKEEVKIFLQREFNNSTLARYYQSFEIHIIAKEFAPVAFGEINRISAKAFGLESDGDIYDETYKYICVYDRENSEIVSFYRYILCAYAIDPIHFSVNLATSKFYNLSSLFVQTLLHRTIEFGRSVVNKESVCEKTNPGIGLTAVWFGLGVLIYEYHLKYINNNELPLVEFLFGKFSLKIDDYCVSSRNMIFSLFQRHFGVILEEVNYMSYKKDFEINDLDYNLPSSFDNFSKNKREVNLVLKSKNEPLPKLAYTYASLGGLKTFHPIYNPHLKSYEMAILQEISKIDLSYIRRFVGDYKTINPSLFEIEF